MRFSQEKMNASGAEWSKSIVQGNLPFRRIFDGVSCLYGYRSTIHFPTLPVMKSHLRQLTLAASLILTGTAWTAVEPDDAPPTLTITSPAAGVAQNTNTITVSGTATDTAQTPGSGNTVTKLGIAKVQYRLKGSSKWHNAILTTGGEATTTWVFTIKLGVGKKTTVSIRTVDRSGNSSDVTVRQLQRSRVTRAYQNP